MTYQYDELNRLTNMSLARLATPIAGYAYALNPSGHRTQVRELGGRTASYGYDNLYRLTQETISGTLIAGQIAYSYDAVGNRLGRNSTVTNILEKLYDYDMNDRSGSDSYDAAGNTVDAELTINHEPSTMSFAYDFENRITSATSAVSVVQILYDGDGNRVAKTVTDGMGSRRIWFLVDDRNLTGYSQVLAELGTWNLELGTGAVTRAYTYGLDLISQARYSSLIAEHSFYGYDGHGNVRCLTDTNGYITDTYDYDAFGTLIEQKAWDPNAFALVPVSTDNRSLVTDNLYLYCGEQFDPDLGLYFLRARYMDTDRGRFWSMDSFEGFRRDPTSLHRYLYVSADPVSLVDPSGHMDLAQMMVGVGVLGILTAMATPVLAEDVPAGTIDFYVVTDGTTSPASFSAYKSTMESILGENGCSKVTTAVVGSEVIATPPEKEWGDVNTTRFYLTIAGSHSGRTIDVTLTSLPIVLEGVSYGGMSLGRSGIMINVSSPSEMLAHELGHVLGYEGHPPGYNTWNLSNVMTETPGPGSHRLDFKYKSLLASYLRQ